MGCWSTDQLWDVGLQTSREVFLCVSLGCQSSGVHPTAWIQSGEGLLVGTIIGSESRWVGGCFVQVLGVLCSVCECTGCKCVHQGVFDWV